MSNRTLLHLLREIPVWVWPLLAVLIHLPSNRYMFIGGDFIWYVDLGLNLVKGNGYVTLGNVPVLIRGPLFPGLIAGAFAIFGVSMSSAFLVVRVFVVANVLLVFVLGQELFDRTGGLIASLLVVFSYTINYWSFRHLDHVIAFFMIAFVHVFIKALQDERPLSYILAGGLLGCGILTKEVAILFIPLPIVYVMLDRLVWGRNHSVSAGLWTLIGTAILYLPWVAYVQTITSDRTATLGKDQNLIFKGLFADGPVDLGWIASSVAKQGMGIIQFFDSFLLSHFFWAPLFILAIGFVVYNAYQGSWKIRIFVISLLGFTPMMVLFGNIPYRVGQAIPIYLSLYICVGGFVSWFIHLLIDQVGLKESNNLYRVGIRIGVIMILVVPQVFVGGVSGDLTMMKKSIVAQELAGKPGTFTSPFKQTDHAAVARWIETETPSNANILGTFTTKTRQLYFLLEGDRSVHYTPVVYASPNIIWYRPSQGITEPVPSTVDTSKLVYLDATAATPDPSTSVRYVTSNMIHDQIQKHNILYVVVDGTHLGSVRHYYKENDDFELVSYFGEYQIYHINSSDPEPFERFEPIITAEAVALAENTRISNSNSAKQYRRKIFKEFIGLDPTEIETMSN